MTVVITGASGFIGRHVIASFLAGGRDVVALTRRPGTLVEHPRLRTADPNADTLDLPRESAVVHLAAVRNAPGNQSREMHAVNIELTKRIAIAAENSRASRFIHLGTSLVLGSSHEPLGDSAKLVDSDDPYIGSKIAAIRMLEAMPDLPLVTILPSIVYGPDDPAAPNRITSHIRRVLQRRWRIAIGGEEARRNLVFVDDVVRAIRTAEAAQAGTRHLVAGENVTQSELEEAVFAAANRKPAPRVRVPRAAVMLAAGAADAVLRNKQGWTRRIDTLLAPWCVVPSAGHTSIRDGIAATVRSL